MTSNATQIEVRNRSFEVDAKRARFWHGGRRAVTAYWDNLSLFFPEGERFFVETVNAHRGQVTDPVLQQEVRDFCAQEGFHRREHARYNALLSSFGYPVADMERRTARTLNRVRRILPRRWQLGVTVALEHFTALLGTLVFSWSHSLSGADPTMAAMWRWHALEENEHKAVTFDVFQAAGGTYVGRCLLMLATTVIFWAKVVGQQVRLMWADGTLFNPREHADLFRFLFLGPGGGMQRLLPDYFAFFSPRFHPAREGDRERLEAWRAQLGG
jgi:uncharacterized protein